MTDLVERLRQIDEELRDMPYTCETIAGAAREAAYEIERLRAVAHGLMKILARPWIDGGVTWPEWDAAMKAAEDALNIKASEVHD